MAHELLVALVAFSGGESRMVHIIGRGAITVRERIVHTLFHTLTERLRDTPGDSLRLLRH